MYHRRHHLVGVNRERTTLLLIDEERRVNSNVVVRDDDDFSYDGDNIIMPRRCYWLEVPRYQYMP